MHAQFSRATPPAQGSDGSAVMQYHPRDQDFEKILSGYSERGGLARSEQLNSLLQRQQRAHVMNAARMVASGHIFSFEWDRTAWIPMFQFEASDMQIKRGPRRVFSELTRVLDRWELALWFIQPNSWLKGRQPLDVMDEDLPAVLNAARSDRFVASGQPVFS